jgi:hypothetical protein
VSRLQSGLLAWQQDNEEVGRIEAAAKRGPIGEAAAQVVNNP